MEPELPMLKRGKPSQAEGSASAAEKPPPYSAEGQGRNPYAVRYISDNKGFGLVATRDLPVGTLIFKERMLVFRNSLDSFHNIAEFNISLAEEVKAMGPEFSRGFFTLPTMLKDRLGVFGGILHASRILALHSGKAVAMIGLNLAFLNHACAPNAQHTWIAPNMLGTGPDDQYHNVTLYACKDISAGEEITIAYHHLHMRAPSRREFTDKHFGFVCACDFCSQEDANFEKYLAFIDEQTKFVNSPRMMDEQPAAALQMAFAIGNLMEKCGIVDCRLAQLFEQCAIIVGWHSDEARALEFLAKAKSVFVNIEGSEGPDIIRIGSYQKDIRTLPHFGWTKRALSRRNELKILWLNPDKYYDMLFMRRIPRNQSKKLRSYEGIKGKDPAIDEYSDAEEEIDTELGSEDEELHQKGETGPDHAEKLDSLIEDLRLEKDEFEKERRQNQADPAKKGKGPKGRKAKKAKGKSRA